MEVCEKDEDEPEAPGVSPRLHRVAGRLEHHITELVVSCPEEPGETICATSQKGVVYIGPA